MIDLDKIEADAREAQEKWGLPLSPVTLPADDLLALVARLRRAEEALDKLTRRAHVVSLQQPAVYADTQQAADAWGEFYSAVREADAVLVREPRIANPQAKEGDTGR